MEQDGQHVYYLAPDRKGLRRVTSDLQQPNGIIGTPDGKRLYVADIRAKKIYVYTINPDGTLGGKKLFADMGSDGMTMDEEENIYVVGKGVTVFNVTRGADRPHRGSGKLDSQRHIRRQGPAHSLHHGHGLAVFDPDTRPRCPVRPIGPTQGFFSQESSQSMTVLYQKTLFCGFEIQWPSSGNSTSFDGTFWSCSAVNNCIPWPTGTR